MTPMSVTGYARKCIDDVISLKTITTHANQKLWITVEVSFQVSTSRANLSQANREAKGSYA